MEDYPCVGQQISRRDNARSYLHLTCEQRCQIYALLQSGHSQAHIARKIGVDPSTISRELVRNTGARGYRFKQAHA
jgi:transposase, IS30 family